MMSRNFIDDDVRVKDILYGLVVVKTLLINRQIGFEYIAARTEYS